MSERVRELRSRRGEVLDEAQALLDVAETEDRDLNDEETRLYDELVHEAGGLLARAERLEAMRQTVSDVRSAPNLNLKTKLGDSEERALAHFVRSGDGSGLRELRASNDTDMNVGTDADGGYAVPTGHYQGIIARRDDAMLANTLGVRRIPGKGTTVNVPIDGEADGEFVSTAEGSDHDRDAPSLGTVAMTLVRYTKKIQLSW